MHRGECVLPRKIGDRARHLENAVIRARRQSETCDRLLQYHCAAGIRGAVAVHLPARQRKVRFSLALELARARIRNAAANCCGSLTLYFVRELFLRHGWHLDLEVDSVEQRSGNPAAVTRHVVRRATAAAIGVPQVAAWARIHRCHQLKLRGEFRLARRARNADAPRFERLAQHLEHLAVEFRQLVEKQHAVHRH